MKKTLIISLILISITLLTCKKSDKVINDCSTQKTITGKWKFVSRKVTDYRTGSPSTPASNVTVNFDPSSYIEFTNDNKFRWYEYYNNKVYKDLSGTTKCVIKDFTIYMDESKGQSIPESIKELTQNKLVFYYHVIDVNGFFIQTVTTELSK